MNVAIIAARRSAFGRIGGQFAHTSIEAICAPVIAAALADAGLTADAADALILGNAAGGDGNVARRVALTAGLPAAMPALTVDTQCASGISAILIGANMIAAGEARIVIAGGAEAPSTAPWRAERRLGAPPRITPLSPFTPPGWPDPSMIEAAEAVAAACGICRARADVYAVAAAARPEAGGIAGSGTDELPRRLNAALTARVKPHSPGGSITPANACRDADGAAFAVLVAGDGPLHILGGAHGAAEPGLAALGAVAAARRLTERYPTALAATTVLINEAFAAQVLATADALAIASGRLNPWRGALTLGHPYGASGAALVVAAFHAAPTGPVLALIAGAGGLGAAVYLAKS